MKRAILAVLALLLWTGPLVAAPVSPSVVIENPNADIQAAIDALGTTGGIVQLGCGTFTLTHTLRIPTDVTVRGEGTCTYLYMESDTYPDSNIVQLMGTYSGLEDLQVIGHFPADYDSGTSGHGIGILVAQPDAAHGGPSWGTQAQPTIRRVHVFNTPSWNIYVPSLEEESITRLYPKMSWDSAGTTLTLVSGSLSGVRAGWGTYSNGWFQDSTYSPMALGAVVTAVDTAAGTVTIDKATRRASKAPSDTAYFWGRRATEYAGANNLLLEDVGTAFPLSGGCLYVGSAAAAPTIVRLLTNGFGTETYQQLSDPNPVFSAAPYLSDMGGVHFFNCARVLLDNCIFQTPWTTSDGVMLSFNRVYDSTVQNPYFEVLGGPLTKRLHPFITLCDTRNIVFNDGYFQSAVDSSAMIVRTNENPNSSVGVTFRDCQAHVGATKASVYQATDAIPSGYHIGDLKADRRDIDFRSGADARIGQPVVIDNCYVASLISGNTRPWSLPYHTDSDSLGYGLAYRPGFREIHDRQFHFPRVAAYDSLAYFTNFGDLSPGQSSYVDYGNGIHSGLWISDRDNAFRQVPFICYATESAGAPSVYHAWTEGDLWFDLTNHVLKFYDGSLWKSVCTTTP
jgi:hypothetical protein